eukprot:scaffold592817_cov46-Prasinocladus_malaysianus.AAC.1
MEAGRRAREEIAAMMRSSESLAHVTTPEDVAGSAGRMQEAMKSIEASGSADAHNSPFSYLEPLASPHEHCPLQASQSPESHASMS